MLVKLNSLWVDPLKVEGISFDDGLMKVTTATNFHHTNINNQSIDDCAAIINNATGQTYGGSEDEAPKEGV